MTWMNENLHKQAIECTVYKCRICALGKPILKIVLKAVGSLSLAIFFMLVLLKKTNLEEIKEAVLQMSVSNSPQSVSSEERKERWEQGQVDYMGEDSYDNIKKKLDSYLQ